MATPPADEDKNVSNHGGTKRASIMILGKVVEDDVDKMRDFTFKIGQRGTAIFSFLASSLYVLSAIYDNDALGIASLIFCGMTLISFGVIYFKNVSSCILKRLLREPNVLISVFLGIVNLLIEIVKYRSYRSFLFAIVYLGLVMFVIFIDAVIKKSRTWTVSLVAIFVLINVFNIYNYTFGKIDNNVSLIEYTIQGEKVIMWKRSTRRYIYIQVLFFSICGIWTLIKDKKMELMMFATGNIYRKTNTGRIDEDDDIDDDGEEEEDKEKNIINKISSRSRNSWNVKSKSRCNSIILLGKEVQLDEGLHDRVKWGQRGAAICAFIGMTIYVISSMLGLWQMNVVALVFGALDVIFVGIVLYRNVSLVILKRLLREPNVVVIVTLASLNWFVEILKPNSSISWLNGLIYLLIVIAAVFIDAVKIKHRFFVVAWCVCFILITSNNIYQSVFGVANNGVKLATYYINGEELTIWKRATQRSMFIQMLLFSLNGVWIMLRDKKMKFMMFATGNIYKTTGTTSNDIELPSFKQRKLGDIELRIEE